MLAHLLALVNHALEPVVGSFNLTSHVSELHADDGVLNELLAKGAALVGVLDGLLVADAGEAQALNDDADTLVVEVGHDDTEALVLLAEQVLHRDLDILKGDVGGSGGPHTLTVHAAGADTGTTLNEQQTDAVHALAASSDSSGEVVGPDTVCDPLLLTVDDEVLAILAELGLTRQVGNITTGIGLGNGQADTLVTGQDAGHDAILEGLGTKLHDGGAADSETSDQVPDETTRAGAGQFISEKHLVEEIPALGGNRLDAIGDVLSGIMDAQETGKISTTTHLLVDFLGHALGLVPLSNIGLNFILHPLTNLGTESSVRLIKVGRVVALIPRGIGKGNHVAKWLEGFRLLIARAGGCLLLGSRSSSGLGLGLGLGFSLGFGVERADLQLALVLFEDALVVVFPKDLGGVLSSDTSENLFAACKS